MRVAIEHLGRDKATLRHRGVEHGGVVGGGEDEAVALRPVRVGLIEIELAEIEGREQVGRAQPLLQISDTKFCHHLHDAPSEGQRPGLQVFNRERVTGHAAGLKQGWRS